MKTKWVLLSGAALSLLVACGQEEDVAFSIHESDVLTVRIQDAGPDTRVSFASANGKSSWTTGDQIAIHFNDGKFYSFTVNQLNGTVDAPSTTAHQRDYHAVYPASIVPVNHPGGSTALEVTLPDEYSLIGKLDSEFSPVPMVALNPVTRSVLDFYHLGGLLRIHCTDLPEGAKTVKVTMDKDITGTYSVANLASLATNSPNPSISTHGTASDNVVTFILSTTTGVARGTQVTLNIPVPCGEYGRVLVEIFGSDTGTPLKTRVFNQAMTFERHFGRKQTIEDMAFRFYFGNISAITTDEGGILEHLAASFTSYKDDGTTKETVPFHLEFLPEGETEWSTTPPDWVSIANMDGEGSLDTDPQALDIRVAAQLNSNRDSDSHHVTLSDESRRKISYDLSTYNVATGEVTTDDHQSTANCYVVQGYGTFTIPLAYGNGYKNGSTNASAYTRQDITDAVYTHLEKYLDHHGDEITSPWIVYQMDDNVPSSTYPSNPKHAYGATLLWTDAPGLITDVAANINGWYPYQSTISFTVPRETVCQGNAVIAALRDEDDDDVPETIVWSWHIWVTDADLTQKKKGPAMASGPDAGKADQFAPFNIGWCEGKTASYAPRTCQVRAIQDISGNMAGPVTITQTGGTVTTKSKGLFYNWGRKDPIPDKEGDFKVYSPVATGFYPEHQFDYGYVFVPDDPDASATSQPLGTVIQHPNRFYRNNTSSHDWVTPSYSNLWNSASKGATDNSVTKTIYDPSPVGYKVPNPGAFSGFTLSNFTWDSTNKGRKYGSLFFPTIPLISGGVGNFYEGDFGVNGKYLTSSGNGGVNRFDFTSTTVSLPGLYGGGYRTHGVALRSIYDGAPVSP